MIMMSFLYGILTVWMIVFIFKFHRSMTTMAGMMAAMATGMTIGLSMGGLLAIWLPDHFFHATFIGMIIGGAVGVMSGIPIGLIAVIDGILSGIMGGMMGSMLMVMIPVPYIELTVKLMAILCSGIIFLVFIMLLGEVKQEFLIQKTMFISKPVVLFSVIVLAFVFI